MGAKKYGYEAKDWDAAMEEMRTILIGHARDPQNPMITYSALVDRVKSIRMDPESYALRAMLGEISKDEDDLGHAMLTVLVVHKDGPNKDRPGQGFFTLARELKALAEDGDEEKFWTDQFTLVTKYWQTH